jgi:hypothetical protein
MGHENVHSGAIAPPQPVEKQRFHLSPYEKKLITDLYLTFKFSQKDGRVLQPKLFTYIAQAYQPSDIKDPDATFARLLPYVKQLPVPQHTSQIDEQERKSEFQIALSSQRFALKSRIEAHTEAVVPEATMDSRLIEITHGLIELDLHYVKHGRKSREGTGKDMHESFVRTYALHGESTNSSSYDWMFSRMNILIGSLTHDQNPAITDAFFKVESDKLEQITPQLLQSNITKLQRAWERTHNPRIWDPRRLGQERVVFFAPPHQQAA